MSKAEPGPLRVSVVYLRPGFAFERQVVLPAPATVGAAIEASGVRRAVAELRDATLEVGVYSRPRQLTDPLCDGDRVEIYRPLVLEPKEARRLRATLRRQRRGAGKPGG